MISAHTLVQIIEKWAPRKFAMEWDNPGLAVGELSRKVSKVLLTLTVTYGTTEYAAKNNFDLIIAHHPLFYKPVKSLRWDTPLGKIVYKAIKNDIMIYSAHTNMDIAANGINDILAKALDLQNTKVLKETYQEELKKLVVFVPKNYEDVVRSALGNAGAGYIGNYSHCSFNADGFGTFKPLAGTKPFIGKEGKLEKANEVRIETIVPKNILKKVVSAVLKVHPYEEVAYDIYPLENSGQVSGLGRIGYVEEPVTLKVFCEIVKQKLDTPHLRVVGDLDKNISKVAVCGGAGSDLVQVAAFYGADALITGDVKYHEALDAKAVDLAIIDAGHFSTENLLMPVLKEYLEQETISRGKEIEISIYKDEDPFVIV